MLQRKGLIRVDYDIPLKNFAYDGYETYPCKGSMALTANGIRVLEVLETQGVSAVKINADRRALTTIPDCGARLRKMEERQGFA